MTFFYTSVDRDKNNILFRGYKNGKAIKHKITYKPTLYIESKENTATKSLYGKPVSPVKFDSMYEASDFCKKYKDVENFRIYGQQDYIYQFISDVYENTSIKFDMDCVNITTFDIEVGSDDGFPKPEEAAHPITTISLKNSNESHYMCWGLYDYDPTKSINKDITIKYVKCKNEEDLLLKFIEYWRKNIPDIVTGWNSKLFDMVYLINRIKKVWSNEMANQLSPWNIIKEQNSRNYIGEEVLSYSVAGIQQLDYYDLFVKFAYTYGKQENYKLDNIGNVVLGEQKIDYSEYGSLRELYKLDFQKFCDYNIKDTYIVVKMEEKLNLIALAMTLSFKAKVNFIESLGSVGIWDAFIYNALRGKNIVIPPKSNNDKLEKIAGAYVKEPIPGMYKWVVSFDLASLYPNIMIQYNMSPETIVNKETFTNTELLDNLSDISVDKILRDGTPFNKYHYSITARGELFDNNIDGIIPIIVKQLYDERSDIRKEEKKVNQLIENTSDPIEKAKLQKISIQLYNEQFARKILMNSLYGATSNQYFRYYDERIAESITLNGQLTIKWAEKYINKAINELSGTTDVDYIIAMDTDSVYITLDEYVNKNIQNPTIKDTTKIIDNLCKDSIQKVLDKCYDDLHVMMNTKNQSMSMKREVIANKGIWTGKKRYILNVLNSEGVEYAEPKLKMMGIEAVKSSTPKICRDMIKDTLKIIMNYDEEETQKFVNECYEKFKKQRAEDIAFPRGVSNVKKYAGNGNVLYKKGVPIHVRAALVYNDAINKFKLHKKYELIQSGDKIKYVYLKVPNTMKENVIGFTVVLPDEFNISHYIDYEKQFEKAFIQPIQSILDTIDWNWEKKENIATLESYF